MKKFLYLILLIITTASFLQAEDSPMIKPVDTNGSIHKMTIAGKVYYYKEILLQINSELRKKKEKILLNYGEFDRYLMVEKGSVYLFYNKGDVGNYVIKLSLENIKKTPNANLLRCLIYTGLDISVEVGQTILICFNNEEDERKLPSNYQILNRRANNTVVAKRIR